MRHMINILLYGYSDPTVARKHRDRLLEMDSKNFSVYLIISVCLFSILAVLNLVSSGFAHKNYLVSVTTTAALLMLMLVRDILKRLPINERKADPFLICVFICILYAQAVAVSLGHPDLPAVSFIGVMLMIPLLFLLPPLTMIVFQLCAIGAFCVIIPKFKPQDIVAIDVWNALTFVMVSAIALMIAVPLRIQSIIQAETIRELSERDVLTGLKNRNSFETDRATLADRRPLPICVFADANGLHELNNTRGHKAGDEMLKAAASAIRGAFGDAHSYRIGGDEFISFCIDRDEADIKAAIENACAELAEKGYHVSFGFAVPDGFGETFDDLIRYAEQSMYNDKKAYYADKSHDRRAR